MQNRSRKSLLGIELPPSSLYRSLAELTLLCRNVCEKVSSFEAVTIHISPKE